MKKFLKYVILLTPQRSRLVSCAVLPFHLSSDLVSSFAAAVVSLSWLFRRLVGGFVSDFLNFFGRRHLWDRQRAVDTCEWNECQFHRTALLRHFV